MVTSTGHIITDKPRVTFSVILLGVIAFSLVRLGTLIEFIPPMDKIFPDGEITVAVDASFPPFAVATAESLFGIDIDLGHELSERFGLPVRFVNMGYDGLYDSLISGQVDVTISALLVDESRKANVAFTWGYFDAGLVLVSPDDAPLPDMTDLPGRTLAYEFGSQADAEARAWSRRIAAFDQNPYELPSHALDALRVGEADAALVSATDARLYLREYPDWAASYAYVTSSYYVMAVRADHEAMLYVVNEAILDMIDDGTLDEILDRWL